MLLLLTVAARQVMIVYENLTLTRDLERKVAERTAELATLGSIVTSSRDAIVGWDLDGTVSAWNPAAEQLFGHRAADVLGRGPDFLPPETQRRIGALLQSAARGEQLQSYEIEWARPDGSERPRRHHRLPGARAAAGCPGISISAQDITAAPARGRGARAGPRGGAAVRAGEVGVPGHHEPRDPHAR